jgi:spore coat polysaccharide biosynthesis predicted glycosyltransferase SpsG
MRWLFIAQDGWGLGHVSRQLGLARQLRRLRPRDEYLFLTYSNATHLIAAEGFASVKLPSPEWFKPVEHRHIDDHAQSYPDWYFAFATPPLLQGAEMDLGLRNAGRFSYYPMAECRLDFDAAISTVGSSAYELAYMGVPAILIPDVSSQKDEDFFAKAQRVVGESGAEAAAALLARYTDNIANERP